MEWDSDKIGFRRLSHEDLPLLYKWIRHDPAVNRFWGYDHEGPYEEFIKSFTSCINREEPSDPYLILYDGRPIGYTQTYLWEDYSSYAPYMDITNAAGMDTLIGEPDFRNKGLGAQVLRRFLMEYIFSDPTVERCIIDPDKTNIQAIRAYEKAGFRFFQEVEEAPGEPGIGYMMKVERTDFSDEWSF